MGTEQAQSMSAPGGMNWRRVHRMAGAGVSLALALAMVLGGFFEPFLIGMSVVALVAVLLTKWSWGHIVAGIVALLILVMNAPFLLPSLTSPMKLQSSLPITLLLTSILVSIIGAVPAFLGRKTGHPRSGSAATVLVLAVVLFVLATGFNYYQYATFESEAAQTGDIEVVASDFEFSPTEIESDSESVAVHIRNEDPELHTFTIDDLGVDVAVPAGKEARATFQASPGEYHFHCVPHPEMEGTLIVR